MVITPIMWVLALGSAALGVFAAGDATARRADAYAAADRQTKGMWAGITVTCAAVFVLGVIYGGPFAPQGLFWVAALVGTLVYLLDVRPRLREVQRGSRW